MLMSKFAAVIGAVVLGASTMTHAQPATSISIADHETSDRWFVELSSAPSSDGTALTVLEREESNFHAAAAAAGIRYRESRHFRDLFNGLSVRATERDAAKIRGLAGVRAVYRDVKISVSNPEVPPGHVTELTTALAQTGVDVAQGALGLTGRGVRVAVIDTGVDYDHPDLGGGFGPGFRVEKGFDFVGDAFNNGTIDTPTPDPDPDDCNGHGTHVAGIIGANGGLKGVAPAVTFNAYRVFGCEGTTTSEIMLDAMELAARDRVDVVNMSIGSALQWPQYPTAQAADRLVRRGIVVVASAGNEGTLGLYATSAPGVGRDVIGVASFDNTHTNFVAFSLSPDDTLMGYTPATGAPPPPTSGSFPMVRTGTTATANDACDPLPPGSLEGRAVLIRRGTCGFYQKAFNAESAGAASVVLYNNAAGFLTPSVEPPPPPAPPAPPITIPVLMITQAQGTIIDGRLAAGSVTLTCTNQIATEPNPTANLISSFSSYGPAADLSFKPDIGAPGGIIRSTLPLEQGGYGPLSGTSMASPHVAGAVALLLQARPRTSPREVQARLQNSARPHLFGLNPATGFLDIVHRQGAGMLQIDDAVTADAVVSPGSLALGEIESGFVTRTLRLKRSDDRRRRGRGRGGDHDGDRGDEDEAITYTLGHTPALSTGANTFAPTFSTAAATVEFSRPTVIVGDDHRGRGGESATFSVKITPPASSTSVRLFGGYITLTPDDGGQVLRVPYTGYSGDYQAIPVFTLGGFPLLAKLTPFGFAALPVGGIFTLQGDDVPFLLLHLNHQVANLKIEVFDRTGISVGFAADEDFLPRNSAANGFFAFAWDGTVVDADGIARAVPNGAYRWELSILKALGDPRNPAHFERWPTPTTGPFANVVVVARPATATTP
jgi:subtilisin family serine protease